MPEQINREPIEVPKNLSKEEILARLAEKAKEAAQKDQDTAQK